jgi:tight adherence protein B
MQIRGKFASALLVRSIVLFSSAFMISLLITGALVIAFAMGSVASAMYWISARRMVSKKSWELFSVMPEIIDHMISGIQSGLSLNEALSNLSERGPVLIQEYFQEFRANLNAGYSFEDSITQLQGRFNIRSADQLFESLIFAKSLGGSELLSMLRQLGDFTRQDLSLRREIAAKQGWIRNSAHLSAGAPWILLLLISAQPSTSQSFATPQGASILALGVGLTALAYLWMGKLSNLPEPKRIFGGRA